MTTTQKIARLEAALGKALDQIETLQGPIFLDNPKALVHKLVTVTTERDEARKVARTLLTRRFNSRYTSKEVVAAHPWLLPEKNPGE